MNQKVKVGIIGFGRMGGFYLEEMRKSDQWEVLYICDTDPEARDLARRKSPTSRIVADEQVVFEDPEVQVVGLFTLADSRLRQIRRQWHLANMSSQRNRSQIRSSMNGRS